MSVKRCGFYDLNCVIFMLDKFRCLLPACDVMPVNVLVSIDLHLAKSSLTARGVTPRNRNRNCLFFLRRNETLFMTYQMKSLSTRDLATTCDYGKKLQAQKEHKKKIIIQVEHNVLCSRCG